MYLSRTNEGDALFSKAFSLYESAFPPEERRKSDEQSRIMQKEAYHFDILKDGDEMLGIMLYWETDRFVFLEHFAILPEKRGQGIGTKALDLLKAKGKTVILEIEDPIDEVTTRRFGFYKRCGFFMTPHHHIQAKFRPGDEDLMLKILSYPHEISSEEYLDFLNYMTPEIGILPQFSNTVTVRPMTDTDDREQVAKLIYTSDKYIYPNWFDSLEDAVKVLSAMMTLPTLYNMKNILIATAPDGKIACVIVACDAPVVMEERYLYEAFALAGVTCDERTHQIYLDYYAKMDEPEGYYLANIASDPAYRGQGIASTAIAKALEGKPHAFLECVKSNIGAWRIYQRLGFVIEKEYPGVFDVPCYKMIRKEG